MDASFLQVWVPIALGCINLGGWLWAILQSPAKKNADALDKLATALQAQADSSNTRLTAVERRTSTMEDAMKYLPDKDSMHKIELSIATMAGDIRTMGAEMKSVREVSIMTRDMVARDAA